MDRVVVEIREPGKESRRVTMTASVEVGRDCSGVIISDPAASRRHAALTPSPEGVTVTDLGSRNGTRVNGRRITSPVNVGPSDVVRIGETLIAVVERTAPPPPSPKAPAIAATEVVPVAHGTTLISPANATPRHEDGTTVRTPVLRAPHDAAVADELAARLSAAREWVTQTVGSVDPAAFERAVLDVGLDHLAEVVARLRGV